MTAAVPDVDRLVAEVRGRSVKARSAIHGESHWRNVATFGVEIAEHTPGADQAVAWLFGLLHDSQRHTDGVDREHGPRAAAFVGELQRGGFLRLSPDQLEALEAACRDHSAGRTTSDPTAGSCWDADRLDLRRLGRQPRPDLLSTAHARTLAANGCQSPTNRAWADFPRSTFLP
jgi:uncharacterized protein